MICVKHSHHGAGAGFLRVRKKHVKDEIFAFSRCPSASPITAVLNLENRSTFGACCLATDVS